jgi:hypothetical protein
VIEIGRGLHVENRCGEGMVPSTVTGIRAHQERVSMVRQLSDGEAVAFQRRRWLGVLLQLRERERKRGEGWLHLEEHRAMVVLIVNGGGLAARQLKDGEGGGGPVTRRGHEGERGEEGVELEQPANERNGGGEQRKGGQAVEGGHVVVVWDRRGRVTDSGPGPQWWAAGSNGLNRSQFKTNSNVFKFWLIRKVPSIARKNWNKIWFWRSQSDEQLSPSKLLQIQNGFGGKIQGNLYVRIW